MKSTIVAISGDVGVHIVMVTTIAIIAETIIAARDPTVFLNPRITPFTRLKITKNAVIAKSASTIKSKVNIFTTNLSVRKMQF